MTDNRLIWIDLETTGLEADLDVPLELGLVVTDMWGHAQAKAKWLCYEDYSTDFQDGMARGANHEIVGPMHDKSGLWDDIADGDDRLYSRAELDELACNWLSEQNVLPTLLPMAGSSIGSLDRPFVLKHFPTLNLYFSYRNVDISTIKELCRRLNPRVFDLMAETTGYNKDNVSHRVLEDIEDSIVEYRYYVDNFLFIGDEVV